MSLPGWIDGRLVAPGEAALPLGDSAHTSGLGCYTTARWLGDAVWHGERSAARLARDATALGIGALDPAEILAAMEALAGAAFDSSPGIVRFEASLGHDGAPCLSGTARPVGPETAAWRATTAPFPHPGPAPWGGAKVTSHLPFVTARAAASAAGADESLLFDAQERLVEGARSTPLFVTADGVLRTPPLDRGGVAGVGLEILRTRFPDVAETDLDRSTVGGLQELLAINGVRGPVAIVALDGAPVGDGKPGPLAQRLREALAPPR